MYPSPAPIQFGKRLLAPRAVPIGVRTLLALIDPTSGIHRQDKDDFVVEIHGEQDSPPTHTRFSEARTLGLRRREAGIKRVVTQKDDSLPDATFGGPVEAIKHFFRLSSQLDPVVHSPRSRSYSERPVVRPAATSASPRTTESRIRASSEDPFRSAASRRSSSQCRAISVCSSGNSSIRLCRASRVVMSKAFAISRCYSTPLSALRSQRPQKTRQALTSFQSRGLFCGISGLEFESRQRVNPNWRLSLSAKVSNAGGAFLFPSMGRGTFSICVTVANGRYLNPCLWAPFRNSPVS